MSDLSLSLSLSLSLNCLCIPHVDLRTFFISVSCALTSEPASWIECVLFFAFCLCLLVSTPAIVSAVSSKVSLSCFLPSVFVCWSLHLPQCAHFLQKSPCLVFCLLSPSVGLYTSHSVRCFFKSLAVSSVTGTSSGCISVHVYIFRQNRSTSTFSQTRFLCH